MTDINRLSSVDEISAGDQIPVYSLNGGGTRKLALSVLYKGVNDLVGESVRVAQEAALSAQESADEAAAILANAATKTELAAEVEGLEARYAAPTGAGKVGAAAAIEKPRDQTVLDVLNKIVRLSGASAIDGPLLQLQRAVNAAVSINSELLIDENISINGGINAPAGLRVRGAGGVITQTAALTGIFDCDGAGRREFRNVQCKGLGSDYVNSPSVYAASAVVARNGATVSVLGCELLNFAGAGVRLLSGAVRCSIQDTKITGAGPSYITSTAFNYSGCVVVDNGITLWDVKNCDLSLASQGIVTGDGLRHVQIVGNYIHDIPGQHGAYIEAVSDLIFSGNNIARCGLTGMKVQIGTTLAPDAQRMVLTGNVISDVGAQAMLITNPVGGTPRLREFIMAQNTAVNTVAGGNAAFHLVGAVGGKVENNIAQRFQRGVFLDSCSNLDVANNRLEGLLDEGMYLTSVTDSNFTNNVVRSPAGAGNSANAWGIQVLGSSARLRFTANDVSDQGAKMRAAMYFGAGEQGSCHWEGNSFVDGQQYGARLLSAQNVAKWSGNTCEGILSPILGFPVGFNVRGGSANRYESVTLPISGIFGAGDQIMLPSPAASASPGWEVITAGAGHSGLWASGATYAAGIWMRNTSARVYKLLTAGAGAASVQPVGTALGVTETGADGYTWVFMASAARFAPLPALGAVAALP